VNRPIVTSLIDDPFVLGAQAARLDGDSNLASMGAHQPRMRVVAASFPDAVRARQARTRLLAELALEPGRVDVQALADASDDKATPTVLLAGQFEEDRVAVARELLEELGGTVMLDVDATGTNG